METIGLSKEEIFYLGEPQPTVPGFYRILDMEDIKQELDRSKLLKLHAVVVHPKKRSSKQSLISSLSDPSADLAFSNISKEVRCINQEFPIMINNYPYRFLCLCIHM